MKRKIVMALAVVFVATFLLTLLPPVTVDAADRAEVNANTYYYDRINPRAQWCYTYLKDFYDNAPLGANTYRIKDFSDVPGGNDSTLGDDFIIADMALKADDPSYDWKGFVAGFGSNVTDGPVTVLFIDTIDLLTEDTLLRQEAVIEQVVSGIGSGDRYTKLRKLTNWFLDNTFYDPYIDAINDRGNHTLATRGLHYNSSIYGVLLEGIAVCEGYAHSVKLFCDELDIPCIIMGNNSHAWNLVQMEDGGWYRLDITNACRLGWDGKLPDTLDSYFANTFLNNDTLLNLFGTYSDPYMIALNNVRYVTDFPVHASGQYRYTGSTTDFSYTLPASTYQPEGGQFSYRANRDGKTCTITNYEGKESGDLTIPSTLDGYTVTAIDSFAFYYCSGFTGKLTIPNTVESIGQSAFAGCYGLTSLELPEKLQSIGLGAFVGCKGLTQVTLPDTLGEIGDRAFYDCDQLQFVTFGTHIQAVGYNAFAKCRSDLVLKAPAGSAAAQYASDNGIAFQASGTMCAFQDADGDWEIGRDFHHHTCEHGAFFDKTAHTRVFDCGATCDVCGGEACITYGMMEKLPLTLVNEIPATCSENGYSGDWQCLCGQIVRWGDWTVESTGLHTPMDDSWQFDYYTHWQECQCGVNLNTAEHFGGTATATQKAKCSVCGLAYGELAPAETTPTTDATESEDPTPSTGPEPTADGTVPASGDSEEPNTDSPMVTVLLVILMVGIVSFLAWRMFQKKKNAK